jgi:hypothetical protein
MCSADLELCRFYDGYASGYLDSDAGAATDGWNCMSAGVGFTPAGSPVDVSAEQERFYADLLAVLPMDAAAVDDEPS